VYIFIHSLIFETAFPMGKIAGAAALVRPEMPHDQQQSQKVSLGPQQDGTKQGRRCSHATWSLDLLTAFRVTSRTCLVNLSWAILDSWLNQLAGIFRFGEVAWHSGFKTCAFRHEVSHQ